jgi:hypothetical protein
MGKPLVQPKVIFYIVVALVVLWGGSRVFNWVQPAFARYQLKRAVARIEPWTTSTNYSPRGWTRLVVAANVFQKADPKLAGPALGQYLDACNSKPDQLAAARGRIVLLLRAVFELPETASAGERMSFVSWTRAGADVNADGTANPSWPLAWKDGRPQLLAGNDGLNAGNCSVQEEYVSLRYRHPYRALANFQRPDK